MAQWTCAEQTGKVWKDSVLCLIFLTPAPANFAFGHFWSLLVFDELSFFLWNNVQDYSYWNSSSDILVLQEKIHEISKMLVLGVRNGDFQ